MAVVLGIAGIVLLLWALKVGLLTRETNKAEVFSGPVGCIVNGVVILIALAIIWWAFF